MIFPPGMGGIENTYAIIAQNEFTGMSHEIEREYIRFGFPVWSHQAGIGRIAVEKKSLLTIVPPSSIHDRAVEVGLAGIHEILVIAL